MEFSVNFNMQKAYIFTDYTYLFIVCFFYFVTNSLNVCVNVAQNWEDAYLPVKTN